MLENHRIARSRTSGEYLLFVFMRSILSRNGVSDNPGAVHSQEDLSVAMIAIGAVVLTVALFPEHFP